MGISRLKMVVILCAALACAGPAFALAAPLFAPGETLNPPCAPTDSDCAVMPDVPPQTGNAGKVLTTDGSLASWLSLPGGSGGVWGSVTGTLADQADLQAALGAKEPSIVAGTTAQYWRGDKTWQTLDFSPLPDQASSAGKFLSTNGTTASWVALPSGSGSGVWGSVTGTLADQGDLDAALDAKEPTIAAGTTAQYWRGDKTWQTLNASAVGLANVADVDSTDASTIASGTLADARLSANVTLGGNAFNGPSQLVQLTAGGALPALDGSALTGVTVTETDPTVASQTGNAGKFLTTNGSVTSWVAAASAAWGGIAGSLADQTDLQSALNGKEGTIAAGTTAQYWRGDKTWQTLDASALGLGSVENTPLSTWAGSSSLTTLGTITTGTWTGSPIGYAYLNLAGAVLNADLAGSISDAKLLTISTAGKVANSATTATSANTAGSIIARDVSGDFSAGTISAALIGNVTGNASGNAGTVTNGVYTTGSYADPAWITSLSATKLTGTLPAVDGSALTGLTKTQVGLANVENTALSTWAGSTNVTTLGTITAGAWNGTTIALANGGTGATTASDARTNLGLGTLATQSGTFSGTSSGTNTGDVTFGTANGLSLVGQALSLGLASTSTTGALSSTDWNTFNGKGSGTVTSVNASGDTTGLTFTGGPITTTGTLTLGGTLVVANGGTGSTTASGARANLGLAIGTDVLAPTGNGSGLTGLTQTQVGLGNVENTALSTWAGSANVTTLGTITTGTWTGTAIALLNGGTGATTASGARTNLGLGTLATQSGTFSGTSSGTNTGDVTLGTANGLSLIGQAVSLGLSSTSTTGALSSTDWNTFNGKGTVTSVSGSGDSTGLTLTGGPITTSGTLTLGGTLVVANGGTGGTATPTNGGVAYGTGSVYAFSAAGTAGQILRSAGAAAPVWSTATYPATAGTAGNILRSDGTNFVSTAVTSSQSTPADPTGTTSTTSVMMGLAGSITPARSGKVMIVISGNLKTSVNNDGASVQIRYGTGTAPANAAAATGTAAGSLIQMTSSASANRVPFSTNAVVSGLTAGTAYWIDVGFAAITGGTATLTNVSISAVEL